MLKNTIKKWLRLLADRLRSDQAKRRREAQRLAKTVLHEFRRLGFSKAIVAKKGKRKWQHVQFEQPLLMTADDLWLPIDLSRLPVAVKTNDLRDENVLKSLEDRLNRAVRYDQLANGKICLVVRVSGSKFPAKIGIAQFAIPQDAHELTFILGIDREGEKRFTDIETLKHLLVVGATGGGKTNFLHTLLNTLITRNDATDIEIWLSDLKSGAEFGRYRSLMGNKKQVGIVRNLAKDAESSIALLDQALAEIIRRNKLMEQHDASNIADLRALTGEYLRPIIIICDEFAQLMLDKNKIGTSTVGRLTENLITRIAALGRSAGVHLILATQMMSRDVLTGLVLANFENRIVFSTAGWRQSQQALETSEAVGLPPGRMLFRFEGKTEEFQTPIIPPEQTRLEINRVVRHGPTGLGESEEEGRFLREAKLLVTMAWKHLDGGFPREKLLALDEVRGVISKDRFIEIATRLERDQVLERNGGRGRGQGRKVVPVFKNIDLLDAMYGRQNTSDNGQTKSETKVLSRDVDKIELDDTNAKKPILSKQHDFVGSLENPVTPMDLDEDVPDAFLRAFQADEEGETNENETE